VSLYSRHELEAALQRTRLELEIATDTLRQAGYTLQPDFPSVENGFRFEPSGRWVPSSSHIDAQRLAAEKQAAQHERDIASAREEAASASRRETLGAVIEALEIKGYPTTSGIYDSLISAQSDIDKMLALHTEREGVINAHVDRFWDDIQTALQVRAEKKRADEREATEYKIASLVRKEPAQRTSGVYVGSTRATGSPLAAFIDGSAEPAVSKTVQLSEEDRALLENVIATKLAKKKGGEK
jgi:hypothetical protein